MTWFQSKVDDGVTFHEHFSPLSIPAIAFVLTVVRVAFMSVGTRVLTSLSRSNAASMSGRMVHVRRQSGANSGSIPCTNHTSHHLPSSGKRALTRAQTCSNTYEVSLSRKHGRSSSRFRICVMGHLFADTQLSPPESTQAFRLCQSLSWEDCPGRHCTPHTKRVFPRILIRILKFQKSRSWTRMNDGASYV